MIVTKGLGSPGMITRGFGKSWWGQFIEMFPLWLIRSISIPINFITSVIVKVKT